MMGFFARGATLLRTSPLGICAPALIEIVFTIWNIFQNLAIMNKESRTLGVPYSGMGLYYRECDHLAAKIVLSVAYPAIAVKVDPEIIA